MSLAFGNAVFRFQFKGLHRFAFGYRKATSCWEIKGTILGIA